MSESEIRKEIMINTSPEKVFKALIEPNEITKWFPDHAIFEPREGGKVEYRFHQPEKDDAVVEGKVIEVIENKKLVYTWEPEPKADFPSTTVSWTLEEIDTDKTKVTLVHVGFASKDKETERKKTDGGWTFFVGRLVKYCQGESLDNPDDLHH